MDKINTATNPRMHRAEVGTASHCSDSLVAPVPPNPGARSPASSQNREYPSDPTPRQSPVVDFTRAQAIGMKVGALVVHQGFVGDLLHCGYIT